MARRLIFSPAETQDIITRHQAGVPLSTMAAERGLLTIKALKRLLRANGLTVLGFTPPRRDVRNEDLSALYEQGLSQQAIAARFGMSQTAIHQRLEQTGIEARPRTTLRKHSLREDAFDEITEESAYWIGFLITDGSIYDGEGKNRITFGLAGKDRHHVERFKEWLGASQEIKDRIRPNGSNPMAVLTFSSARALSALKTHGVIRNKSLVSKASDILATNRHFWRGVIDGNGCLGVYRNNPTTHIAILNLSGSKSLLTQFRAFILSLSPTSRATVRQAYRGAVYYQYSVAGTHCHKALHALYSESSIALPRKYEIAAYVCGLSPMATTR